MAVTIVAFGKIKEPYWREAASEYLKRLRPYARLKIIELKAEAFSSAGREAAKKIEGERLAACLSGFSGAAIFLLAEKGQEFDSLEFSKKLSGTNVPLVLVIGGALGFSSEIFASYPKLSLSKLTFPHELARVVLLEQLYRAATIANDKTYHY